MQSVHMRLDIGPSPFQYDLNIWDQLAPTGLKYKILNYLLLNLYGLLLCIFYIYYALATYIIYYYYLFISKLAIGNWKFPSLKSLSPQLLFFFLVFFLF